MLLLTVFNLWLKVLSVCMVSYLYDSRYFFLLPAVLVPLVSWKVFRITIVMLVSQDMKDSTVKGELHMMFPCTPNSQEQFG